jgi:H+/gluconate symporter-like permease
LILAAIEIAWGFWWLFMWQDRMKKNGEHFVPGPRDKELVELAITGECVDTKGMPNFAKSITPILVVLVFIGVFTKKVDNATFAVNLALIMGIISIYALHSKTLVDRIEVLNESAANSIISLLNTAVVVGFGGVVKNCGGFAKIVDIAMSLDMSPLISGSLGVILISMACGSASGGLSTFLDALGEQYKQLAISQGISLEAMHKIFAISADALDSLPHSGGYITAIVATDLNHKETYPIFFGTNSLTPIIAWICGLILYMNFGIV